MTLPNSLLRAIGNAVELAGGDMDDVDDLVDVWERLDADLDRRGARMRFEAEQAGCCCLAPTEPGADGRCSRCWGRPGVDR
jgi:hypothetical protein